MGIGENVGENTGLNIGQEGYHEQEEPAPPIPGTYTFQDDFETGDALSTNAQGFAWDSMTKTGIFNASGMVYKHSEGYINPPATQSSEMQAPGSWSWRENSSSDWGDSSPSSGPHFLNFLQGTGFCEQRYFLGAALPEVWVRFWMRPPDNMNMSGTGTPNNKWFVIWNDDYSAGGLGSTVVWQIFSNTPSDPVGATQSYVYGPGCYTNIGNKNSPCGSGVGGSAKPFINSSTQLGKWMQVCYYVKNESFTPSGTGSPGSHDGVIRSWQRWEDNMNWVQLDNNTSAHLRSGRDAGSDGFSAGYILGHWNRSNSSQNEWHLDEFTVSDSSLL